MRGVRPWQGAAAALASAVGGVLLAPAGLLAAGEQAARMEPSAAAAPAPNAVLEVSSGRPTAGIPVELDASGSSGIVAGYRWDLDGDGTFETDGGASAATAAPFEAGAHRVGVEVVDEAGRTDSAHADLSVAAAEPRPDAPEPPDPRKTAPTQPAAQAESEEAPDSACARGRAGTRRARAPSPRRRHRPRSRSRTSCTRRRL